MSTAHNQQVSSALSLYLSPTHTYTHRHIVK
uniref:Uncharacterized protein n=1 Tax=Rhizophora mucronata TaxID=61149 RepID=A0A2P2N5Q1_RHIMU